MDSGSLLVYTGFTEAIAARRSDLSDGFGASSGRINYRKPCFFKQS
jgi:hypothetical protein